MHTYLQWHEVKIPINLHTYDGDVTLHMTRHTLLADDVIRCLLKTSHTPSLFCSSALTAQLVELRLLWRQNRSQIRFDASAAMLWRNQAIQHRWRRKYLRTLRNFASKESLSESKRSKPNIRVLKLQMCLFSLYLTTTIVGQFFLLWTLRTQNTRRNTIITFKRVTLS